LDLMILEVLSNLNDSMILYLAQMQIDILKINRQNRYIKLRAKNLQI